MCRLSKVVAVDQELTEWEEEFLIILAKQVKNIAFYLGPDCVKLFIPIIHNLLASEDTSVRETVGSTD